MIGFGFGEVIGGFFMGWFIERFNAKMACVVNVIVVVVMILFTLITIWTRKFGFFTYLTGFLWGIQDGCVNIHTLQTLGFEFGDMHSEPFGVFNLIQGISVFLFQLLQSQIDDKNGNELLLYTLLCGVIGIGSCWMAYYFPYELERSDARPVTVGESILGKSDYNESLVGGVAGNINPSTRDNISEEITEDLGSS